MIKQRKQLLIHQSVFAFLNRGGFPGSPENPMDPMGVPLVPGPDGQLINENLMKLTGGDRDELERRRQILGGM